MPFALNVRRAHGPLTWDSRSVRGQRFARDQFAALGGSARQSCSSYANTLSCGVFRCGPSASPGGRRLPHLPGLQLAAGDEAIQRSAGLPSVHLSVSHVAIVRLTWPDTPPAAARAAWQGRGQRIARFREVRMVSDQVLEGCSYVLPREKPSLKTGHLAIELFAIARDML